MYWMCLAGMQLSGAAGGVQRARNHLSLSVFWLLYHDISNWTVFAKVFCMSSWQEAAALGKNSREWMLLRILFSLLSSFLAVSSGFQAPLLSNLISPRETEFAAVPDHLGIHPQRKFQLGFTGMAQSYPSTFECRDRAPGPAPLPALCCCSIPALLAFSSTLTGTFLGTEGDM